MRLIFVILCKINMNTNHFWIIVSYTKNANQIFTLHFLSDIPSFQKEHKKQFTYCFVIIKHFCFLIKTKKPIFVFIIIIQLLTFSWFH